MFNTGLGDTYYILCVDEARNWWQLRKTDDHQVVACGVGKEFVLKALKKQVERYKTKENLQSHWNSLEYTKPLNKEEKDRRRLQYEVVKDISKEETDKIISLAPKTLVRRRRDIEDNIPVVETPVEEIKVPKVSTIRRRRLVKK